ncbi:hypothetical protein D9M69_736460 [compost metagenome]
MTTQHMQHQAAQVLLHPAAASNPEAIRTVQRATGRLIVLRGGKPTLASRPLVVAFSDEIDPFGGDAA